MRFNEDEKRCIRIIAKWFRENKRFVNRDEAMNEFGVDNDQYDVLIKTLEHNGVVENVRSHLGKDGFAIAFRPSAYAEELAREFNEENEGKNKGHRYSEGKYDEGPYVGKDTQREKFRDLSQLSASFEKFLREKKGYDKATVILQEREIASDKKGIAKGIRQYLAIFEHENHKMLAIVEFGLIEDDSTIKMAWEHLQELSINIQSADIEGYVVFPDQADLGEDFTIIQFHKNTEEMQRIFCDDFPDYEELRRNVVKKTEDYEAESRQDDRNKSFIDHLISFLINEKEFPRESLNWEILTDAPYIDFVITYPGNNSILAIFDIESGDKPPSFRKTSEILTKVHKVGFIGQYNPFIFMVYSSDVSNEDFWISELDDDASETEILKEDFPTYTQLLFASPLSDKGRQVYRELVRIAKHDHGFIIHTPSQDYINLKIKKDKITSAQIHRYGEPDPRVGLVLAGYIENFPSMESSNIASGVISLLSGFKSGPQTEINWLKGNIGHQRLKYEAGVYILSYDALVSNEMKDKLSELLELAKNNAEKDEDIKEQIKVTDGSDVEITGKQQLWEISTSVCAVGDSETEEDTLGFGPYVEAVAEFLVHEDTKPPLTISIEGEWGSGKSSFMRQLQKEIRRIYDEQDKGTCFIVEFDPWRHDKDEALWAVFALKFVRQVSAKLSIFQRFFANICLKITQFDWREGWADFLKVIALSIIWLVVTGVLISLVYNGVELDKNGNVELPGWIGSIAVIAGALLLALGKVKDLVGTPLAVDLKKYMKKPDYVNKISFIEQFHKDFKEVVHSYAGNERVYVFVDDLDRCEVPKAAELMESINLMLSEEPNLVFIMGMDREKVAAGLAVKHEKLLPYLSGLPACSDDSNKDTAKRKGGIWYGYSFIEKFIQIPFVLPTPSKDDIENMLLEMAGETIERVETIHDKPEEKKTEVLETENSFVPVENIPYQEMKEGQKIPYEEMEGGENIPYQEMEEKERAKRKEARKEVMLKFEGDDKNFREVVLMVSEAFGNNPRRVKQFVNLFRLRIRTSASTGLIKPTESRFTFAQLGKFVGIGLGWPLFIRDLERDHKLLDRLVDIAEDEEKQEEIYEKAKEWAEDKRLIGLIKSGCFDEKGEKLKGDEYERFCMRNLDIERLLKISPRIIRGEVEQTEILKGADVA